MTGSAAAAITPGLRGRLTARASLDAPTREAMFALLRDHFDGVDRATFDADLAEKTAAILLEDDDRVLRGFSTLLVYPATATGRDLTIVYSGDTIVHRRWWGSPSLARSWIAAVRELTSRATTDVYWLLLTSGFRTYRFLPVFFRTFHPGAAGPAPPETQSLIDALARDRFGPRYDAGRGIVRLARPQVLASDLRGVPEARAADPHVRFFLARNPGYGQGDELVCLTRIADDNLTAAGRRMVRASGGVSCG